MHNIRRFYYQNKEKIWKVVLIIAFLLGLIYYLNWTIYSKKNNTENVAITNKNDIYSDSENKTYISNESVASGATIDENEVEKINNTVSKFLQYCKNGKAEEAYNMLSNDCKESEYNTLENFKNKYLKKRFNKENIYEIEKWINSTYKISISEDLLATGNISGNQKQIEYITIVEEDSKQKLNINSFIGKKIINKKVAQNNINITVLSKKIYMDYEIYDFKIENLSNKTIKLDSFEKIGTMYLKDSNGNKYNAHSHEILEEEFEIKSNRSLNISIKYANTYSNRITINEIIFERVILDYMEYKNQYNVEKSEQIKEIKIVL